MFLAVLGFGFGRRFQKGGHLTDRGIGVVVLNWNNHPDTIICLDSLAESSPRPEAVLVVDNASHDDSVERIRAWAASRGESEPWLTILVAEGNLGFAGGNNLGLRHLTARPDLSHFLLLNNDTTVAPNCFAQFSRAIEDVPDAGLLTGTIYEFADRSRAWYAGGRFELLRSRVRHDLEVPEGDQVIPTEFVCGCAMLIARPALEAVGFLAECYFPVYMEDAEYSYRVLTAGLPAVYVPTAQFYHKVGATVGMPGMAPLVIYAQIRHHGFFVRRNLRGIQKLGALLYLAMAKPARAMLELLSGRPRIAWAALRGTLAGFFSSAAGRPPPPSIPRQHPTESSERRPPP
jgi:GT2 family glycosyltransferase